MNPPIIKILFLTILYFVTLSQADIAVPGYQPVRIISKIINLKKYPIVVVVVRYDYNGEKMVYGKRIYPDSIAPECYGSKLFWVTKKYFDSTGLLFIKSQEMKNHFKYNEYGIDSINPSPIHLLLDDANILHGKIILHYPTKVNYLERQFRITNQGNTYRIYQSKQIWHMKDGSELNKKIVPIVEQNDLKKTERAPYEFYSEEYFDSIK